MTNPENSAIQVFDCTNTLPNGSASPGPRPIGRPRPPVPQDSQVDTYFESFDFAPLDPSTQGMPAARPPDRPRDTHLLLCMKIDELTAENVRLRAAIEKLQADQESK